MTDTAVTASSGSHTEIEAGHPPTSTGLSNEKVAMWSFLGSECLLFGALISTYLLFKGQSTPGSIEPVDVFDIPYTSVSSFVLLMSSLTMVLALAAIQRGDHRLTRIWLLTTALLGASFVAGQAYEFTVFVREGMNLRVNLFSSSFFVLTGFHGAHVTIGVLMLLSLYSLSLRGKLPASKAETVELVGLYWHFVDVVWIVIFTLIYLIP
ncbi:MAG TPA: heme-copper oxidase subunit III [Acidimicrobiales bacterium]|nr:heme-copper oxidase subunit III [Acidimicrobiales bacterium]